jgi:uncharacterized membrane protein (GlpM family)
VPALQKTNETIDKAIILTAPTLLIYFISYFFIFIYENQMEAISLDYATALMSLIPTIVFLAAIYIFFKKIK